MVAPAVLVQDEFEKRPDPLCVSRPRSGHSRADGREARRHLPWGSFPFGGGSQRDRHVRVCLTRIIRSQGFSPSQRFGPAQAVWLYFAPLPPLGLWPPERSPLSQPQRLSTPVTLVLLSQRERDVVNHVELALALISSVWQPSSPVSVLRRGNASHYAEYIIHHPTTQRAVQSTWGAVNRTMRCGALHPPG